MKLWNEFRDSNETVKEKLCSHMSLGTVNETREHLCSPLGLLRDPGLI